jgi:nitroreductase
MMPLANILDLARWAPSGDNTQPWRFAIEAPDRVVVFGHDTRTHCVYDLDGRPSQISLGAMLETIAIAATRFGLRSTATRREHSPDERPVFDVLFRRQEGLVEDVLAAHIEQRCVQRRPLRLRALAKDEKQALERAVRTDFRVMWFEGWAARLKMAWLNFTNAEIRLTLREAYQVHRDVIEWGAQFSEDKIPSAALGASPATLILMRWAMASWERIAFLNRYAAGTLAPRIELDLLPGLACAAHCVLVAQRAPTELADYVAVGRALQRFWLTAASLGLQFQPQYTPLVFARYAREGLHFSADHRAIQQAAEVRGRLDGLLGGDVASRAVFMGRIGAGKRAKARSIRLPLERLLQPSVGTPLSSPSECIDDGDPRQSASR